MKFLLTLAFKNLARYRQRTIITALAIAAGVGVYIFMDAWLLGAEKESVRNLIKYEIGSARIFHKLFWENYAYLLPKYNITDYRALITKLETAGYKATPRLTLYADMWKNGGDGESITIQLSGIDPLKDSNVFSLKECLQSETDEFLKENNNEILIGFDLATRLEIKAGETVELRTKTKDGVWTGFQAKVIGLLNTPNPIVNSTSAFVPLSLLKRTINLEEAVTEIVIGFAEDLDPEEETKKINELLKKTNTASYYRAYSFNEIAAEFGMIAQTKSAGSKMLLFLIFIIAAIGVSNTMLMAVFERVREIGMMRALGMNDRSIVLAFFLEACGLGLLGALLGVGIGIIANFYMVNVGIDFSAFLKNMGNIGYRTAGVLKSAWNFQTIISSALLSIVFSGLMALIPVRRALKKEITECLRVK